MEFREEQELLESKLLSNYAKQSKNSVRNYNETPSKYRTAYQEDSERILYSDAFRRLRSKTQVFYASGKNQHDRTRLTHTLEVAYTSKIISKVLKLNTDLVEAIALGHDLGHAPFGHAGERALNNCLKKYDKSFNHNAQSVWVASTMPIGRENIPGKSIFGFNLTLDTLEGIWKHTKIDKSISEHCFVDNLAPSDTNGSLEAQVVNISDTISYNYHDIMDAINNGIISKEEFIENYWNHNFHGVKFNKNTLINVFIYDLIENNKNCLNEGNIKFSDNIQKSFLNLKEFNKKYIISSKRVNKSDNDSMEKIETIFNYYIERVEKLIQKDNGNINKANNYKLKKYGPGRVVTDYIQWFGDETANREYLKITEKLS